MSKPKLQVDGGVAYLAMGIACLLLALFDGLWLLHR